MPDYIKQVTREEAKEQYAHGADIGICPKGANILDYTALSKRRCGNREFEEVEMMISSTYHYLELDYYTITWS